MSHLLKNPNSEWFDDLNSSVHRSRDDIIRKSVSDALVMLKNELGGDLKEWQWGRLHTVTFGHVFGLNKLLSGFFNIGPFPIGGSHSTINVGQYFIAHSFESAVGPSMRQVFNLADINDTRSILPPGQSGQVFSDHYKDQVTLWLNGEYKTRPVEQSIIESTCRDILIIKPMQ